MKNAFFAKKLSYFYETSAYKVAQGGVINKFKHENAQRMSSQTQQYDMR